MSDELIQPAVESQKVEEPAAQKIIPPNEIAKLHRECAKYRNALKSLNDENADIQKQLGNVQSELESANKQNFQQSVLHKLELNGCLKPLLVLKDIPEDCNDIDEFLASYKKENSFLFKSEKIKHGFSFKNSRAVNYSPSQQMNNYIRSALGR